MSHKNLVVIGGGAAGFFCAVNAARMNPNLRVTMIEKTGKLLSKVKVSGGGRCNVTHALFDIGEMSKRYPRGQHFVKKTFHQFFTTDTIQWFEERGVKIRAEEDGRMFPVTNSSQTIIDCLLQEAGLYGVNILTGTEIKSIQKKEEFFHLGLSNGASLPSVDYLCIASGGYPKAEQFNWLQSLGHSIEPPVPSLFTFNLRHHPVTALMGVVAEQVRVKIEGTKLAEAGPLLITHWGLSGPAVLRLSAWGARDLAALKYIFRAHINWLPEQNEQTLKEVFQAQRRGNPSQKITNFQNPLPKRLWHFLLETSGIREDVRWADLPAKLENALVKNLVDYVVDVEGKTTFKEEFVTAGGIALTEVDPNSMMSRKIPQLYFAGEVLDVDGITGGFNFQHAWTSGWIAARHISSALQG